MAAIAVASFVALVSGLLAFPLPWKLSLPWVPSLGVGLDIRIDALSAQFLALITGIGALVFIYAPAYMQGGSGGDRPMSIAGLGRDGRALLGHANIEMVHQHHGQLLSFDDDINRI